jgi:nicotinamide mononucleotide transporter
MSVWGFIALIFGLLGVVFTIKQHVICWFFACIGASASIIEFYNQRLFGDMLLQVFYFFAGIYGWIYWQEKAKSTFVIIRLPKQQISPLILATALQSMLYCFILKKFNGDQIVFDAILTACSLTATFMMTKKWLENWAVWVFVDTAYVFLYCIKHMWLFAVLYFCFAVIAYWGWLKWKKTVS